MTINYTEFIGPMIKAIQELTQLNNELKQKNNNLENRLLIIENKLSKFIEFY